MIGRCTLTALFMVCGLAAWADSHASGSSDDGSTTPAPEADFAAAEAIFQKSCRACHGNRAQGVASYPKLSDKEPAYIAEKLEIYRSGERIGPNSVLMIQHARELSDEDIANLSVYVATVFD